MKIVLATGIYYPEIGGPALLVKELAQELKQRGHEPLVLTYANRRKHEPEDFLVIRIYRSLKILNYFKYFLAALKNIAPTDQVVVFDTFSAALPIAIASWFKNFEYAVRLGGDFLWETAVNKFGKQVTLTDYYRTRFKLTEVWYFLLIRFIFRRAKKLIATAAYQQDLIEEHYGIHPVKFFLLPNAFPQVSIASPEAERKKQLIFAGRFTKLKNLGRLIESLAKIKDTDYKLLLVGEGPEERNLRQEVLRLKLADRVIFTKPVFGNELDQLIRVSMWLILPSFSDISPNSVFRSIALGTPVLMTKHSGLPEVFGRHLFFLKYPLNTEELTTKLDFLLELDADHYASVLHALTKIDQSYGFKELVDRFLLIVAL